MSLKQIFFLWALGLSVSLVKAQSYNCQKAGSDMLIRLVGTWQVEAMDRISPGNYEVNAGVSVISNGLTGCSIRELYKGIFKEKAYAVEATFFMKDSLQLQRVYYDSEHSNVMVLEGGIKGNKIEMYWFRNHTKKMQVKFNLSFNDENSFEWITQLSTDYGETWQLTHHWKYVRVSVFNPSDKEQSAIEQTILNYHKGLIENAPDLVLSSIGDQFIMWNGNFSINPVNWQAHMSLSGENLKQWPLQFLKEAGPYWNECEVLTMHTRADAAVVTTLDTGQNKFRKWKNERTTWLLAKQENSWKILGYYLQDISNP